MCHIDGINSPILLFYVCMEDSVGRSVDSRAIAMEVDVLLRDDLGTERATDPLGYIVDDQQPYTRDRIDGILYSLV